MVTPSLVKKLSENYRCSSDICKTIEEINSTETQNFRELPVDIQYKYLKHEVMVLTGLHKHTNLAGGSGLSYGCRNKISGIQINDLSYCVYHFLRFLTFIDNSPPLNEAETKKLEEIFNYRLAISNSKSNSSCMSHKGAICSISEYLYKNRLVNELINPVAFMMHHLFFGPDDVAQDELVAIVNEDNGPNQQFFGPNKLPILDDKKTILYLAGPRLLHISISMKDIDEDTHDLEHGLTDYLNSLKIRLFNDRILKDFLWVEEKCAEIIKNYGYPKIVVIPETSSSNSIYASQISKEMYIKVNQDIGNIYLQVDDNATESGLDRNFPGIPLKDMTFTAVSELLPSSFWCDEQPCAQKLFDNFNRIPSNMTYEIYAFHLEYMTHKRKIELINGGYNRSYIPDDFHETIRFRLHEFINVFQMRKYSLESAKRTLFHRKSTNLLYELIEIETLLSTDDFNSQRYDYAPSYFAMQDKTVLSHSFSILKSIDGSTWYLISNSGVMKVINLKMLLDGKPIKETLNTIVTESFWHEEISYREDIQNLIPRIKPILLSDYKRKIIKDLNNP
ncbi:hypothetical protein SNEBB_003936 [Seison nebaliae]|nr:hypothetical protein SNEBB_003936 [Seison nebaliae]